MAKPFDILNKSGTGGFGSSKPSNTVNISSGPKKDTKGYESIAAKKPNLGHNLSKGGKAQGGGGQSSARPKV